MKPLSDKALTAWAIAVTACIVALCGYLLFANVGDRWACGLAVATIAFAWIVRGFSSARRGVTTSLLMAGAILLVALGAKALSHLGWAAGSDIGERVNGIMMGAVVVAFSNAIPKQMGSANTLAMLRTVGRALVLGGLGFALAWLVLPLRLADTVAIAVLLACTIVAAASYIGWRRTRQTLS